MYLFISSRLPFSFRYSTMKTSLLKSAVTMLCLTAAIAAASNVAIAHENFAPQLSNEATINKVDTPQDEVGKKAKTEAPLNAEGAAEKKETGNETKPNRGDRMAQFRAAEEERRAVFAARIREVLTKAGFADTTTQDAIIAYIASEEQAKGALRNATRRLASSLRREAPPERVRDLLADYKKATDAEKARKDKSRLALDEKIGYSKNPRLEAILLISGILGDGSGFRFDMVMQRSTQGQWSQQNAQQKGTQGANPTTEPNRVYPGAREQLERERAKENKKGTPEAADKELVPEAIPQLELN
jgi:hypothetical protein